MANRSLPQSSFFRCTELNASSSTFPMAACLPFPSAFRPRPDLIPPQCSALPELTEKKVRNRVHVVPRLVQAGTRLETVANLYRAQPTHAAADDFRSFYCDPT